ncbi:MAG: hypothetical protein ACK50L_09165 [Bacteroidota bacterium]
MLYTYYNINKLNEISIQGGAGYFSGTGKVFVPMFGSIINVTFNNVFVDDNQTVLSGNFYAVTKGIKNWIKDWEVIQDSLNKVFTNFNNSKDTTALINSLQQMCQDVQQSRDSTFINAFNGILTPGGTFVLPKAKADALIQQAGGDVNKLEDLLGLNRGDLGTKPYRIDVNNPSGLRMPSGNEPGANEFWIPGGKTSGGIIEATVDQIQLGTYTKQTVF